MRLGKKRIDLSTKNVGDLLAGDRFKQSPADGPLQWICDDFAQTRTLSPPQLLFALEQGLMAEDMNLHFDYVAMHERCVNLLQSIRVQLISTAAEMIPEAYHESLARYKDLEFGDPEFSPATFLSDDMLRPGEGIYARLTSSILMSSPAGATAAECLDKDAKAYSSFMRECCGVSLVDVAQAMKSCIDQDGSTETEKAERCNRWRGS